VNVEFGKWLITEKNYTERSSFDVKSRLKRAYSFCCSDAKDKSIDIQINLLESNEDYKKLSVSVKSQLKRALTLYNVFSEAKISK